MSLEAGVSREKKLGPEELLQKNAWDVDHRPHITVDYEKCGRCTSKPCILLCPGNCFTLVGDRLVFSYASCLECGTCRIVCPHNAIDWNYPLSGRGVRYRFS